MSSHNAASNVIPMREFERPPSTQQAAQFDRLLQECRGIAVERVAESLAAMLEKADEALWKQAESSTQRELRDRYLRARDTLRSQRRAIEEQFRDNFLAEFERRLRRTGKAHDQFSQYDFTSTELDLVADDDLEETLKVDDMAAKVRRYCEEELAALDQRVGVLVGDATLQGESDPFSPQAICLAFKQTCRHVEPDLKVRMLFHALFDEHVLDGIRSIYRDLNALLVERSILPKIRYGGTRKGAEGAAAQGTPADADSTVTDRAAPAPGEPASGQDFFAVLQNLLGVTRPAGVPGAGPQVPQPAGGAQMQQPVGNTGGSATQIPGFPPIMTGGAPAVVPVVLQGAELLGSLTRIQHGDVSMIAGGNLPLSSTLVQPGTINVLRELKDTSLGGGLGQMDAMTLDIVSMLFDEIFDDERVAVAIKGLIGRLQIPMLKVALLDKSFFSDKAHPARRLLDVLGEIGADLPEDFDHNSALYRQIEAVLQKLIDGFREEMQIFDDSRAELEGLVAEQDRDAADEAARVAEGIEQREKLEVAKTVAQEEIKRRAEERKIPRIVLRFLAEQWVKLLLVAHAKHGVDSELWKNALSTMDLLIWSVTPMPALEDRRVLGTKLPGLLRRLRAGMQLISVDEDTRKQFFRKLMRCHTNIINGMASADGVATKPAAPASAAAPAPSAGSAPQTDSTRAPREAPSPGAPAPSAPAAQPKAEAPSQTPQAAPSKPSASATQTRPPVPVPQAVQAKPTASEPAQAKPSQPSVPETQAAPVKPAAAQPTQAPQVQPSQASVSATQAAQAKPSISQPTQAKERPAPPLQAAPAAASAASPQAMQAGPAKPPASQAAAATQARPSAPAAPTRPSTATASATPVSPAAAARAALPGQPAVSAPAPTSLDFVAGDDDSLDFTGLGSEVTGREASGPDEDIEPVAAPPSFSKTVIENPFGGGQIEVEEINLSETPGASGRKVSGKLVHDEHTRLVATLREGAWIELRNERQQWQPARLSYISPVKGIFLFVNRQGRKIGEYSLVQLAREFRSGRAAVLDSVPLFDRAMTSLVGVLKGGPGKA